MKKIFGLLLLTFFFCLAWTTPGYSSESKEKLNVAVDSFLNKTGDKELEWLTVGYPDLLKQDLAVISKLNVFLEKGSPPLSGGEKKILVRGEISQEGMEVKINALIINPEQADSKETISLQGSKAELLSLEKELAKKIAAHILNFSSAKLSKEEEKEIAKQPTTDSLLAVASYYQYYNALSDWERKAKQVELVDKLFNGLLENGMEYQPVQLDPASRKVVYEFRVKPEFVRSFIETLQPFALEKNYQYGFQIDNPLLGKKQSIYLCKDAQDRVFLYRKKLKLVLLLRGEKGEVLKEIQLRPLIASSITTFGKLFSADQFIREEYEIKELEEETLSRVKEVGLKLAN